MFPSIKNYTIVREVGSGGMAVVYEAVDTRMQRTVALKVLDPHLCKEPTASDLFISEAKAAAKIDHPNVVRIFDYGAVGAVFYIVMEFVPGTTMERILRVRGALRPTIAMEIMHEIAEALLPAHNAGIVHRNIKPSNILLHKQGRAMLSDFGPAYYLPDSGMTTKDPVHGKPTFMSPEQIRGNSPAASSDIFSWGVCFYTLLTGKLPYGTQKFPEIIEEIRRGAVTPDPVLMASLPPHYHDLLSRCLLIDPAKRIKDGSELLRQINSVKNDRSVNVDLKSLCGDVPEEYDAPKTSRSVAAAGTRKKNKRFPAAAAFAGLTIAVFAGVGSMFFGKLPARLRGPDRVEPQSASLPAPPAKPLPRDTVPTNRAQEVFDKMEREPPAPSPGSPVRKQRLAAKPAIRPVPQPESGPNLLLADTSQALLDSFNMLSPEPTEKKSIRPTEMPDRQADTGARK